MIVNRWAAAVFSIVVLFLMVGCGTEATQPSLALEAAVVEAAVFTPTPAPIATLPPPLPTANISVSSASEVAEPAAFSPVDPNAVATEQMMPTETAVFTPTPTANPTITPTPTATATPIPTFTPPALPQTSNNEHYWLRRPVREGGVVWTNKVYHYASTRGGTLRAHHGVEFDVDTGTEIIATASGTVVFSGADTAVLLGPQLNFYGNVVVIELDSRYKGQAVYTLYAHLSQPLVSVGQHVDSQELIALSGASGVADGPHMHFEVRLGTNAYDSSYNPLLWLYPFPDYGTVAGRVVWSGGTVAREAAVTMRRVDGESRYFSAVTYADVGKGINPDPVLDETFVFDDVPAGFYAVTVETAAGKFTEEFWVFPYQTAFVEVVIE